MREEDVSEKQRSDLDIINRSGEYLLNLINDVLDVAKVEAGRGVLEVAPCELTSVVREVMDMMRVRAEAKHLTLRIVQSDEFPVYVRADAPKIRQVLINLVGNAIKYTEKGSVTLRLHAGHAESYGKIPAEVLRGGHRRRDCARGPGANLRGLRTDQASWQRRRAPAWVSPSPVNSSS